MHTIKIKMLDDSERECVTTVEYNEHSRSVVFRAPFGEKLYRGKWNGVDGMVDWSEAQDDPDVSAQDMINAELRRFTYKLLRSEYGSGGGR